jgi:hypothetical protein
MSRVEREQTLHNKSWKLQRSTQGFAALPFGLSEDKPSPGDYDGDGKNDVAVYHPSSGVWYLLRSSSGFTALQFGLSEDVPVPSGYIP